MPTPTPSPAAAPCASRASPAPTLFGGGRSSVEWATFVNGLLIRYLDYNDTYLSLEPAHPSDNLAAVLAVGDMVGRRRHGPHHRRRAGLRDPVPAVRRRQPAQARRRSRHLRRHLVRRRRVQAAGPRRGEDHARRRHRRRLQRGPAADAVRRAEHVEGLRLRQRRPQRRLRRPARRRGADRPGPDLRGRPRLHEAGDARAVRRWPPLGGERQPAVHDRPRPTSSSGRPSTTRRAPSTPPCNCGPRSATCRKVASHRHPHVRGAATTSSASTRRRGAPQDARDGRPQPALLHRRRPDRRRRDRRAVRRRRASPTRTCSTLVGEDQGPPRRRAERRATRAASRTA